MHAKSKKTLNLNAETLRRLTAGEIANEVVGGATRLCTGAVSTCPVYTCYC